MTLIAPIFYGQYIYVSSFFKEYRLKMICNLKMAHTNQSKQYIDRNLLITDQQRLKKFGILVPIGTTRFSHCTTKFINVLATAIKT
jgi:hypothetical protein